MQKANGRLSFVIDTEALAEVSQTANNVIRASVIGLLEVGDAGVPSAVWSELKEAYEEEAEDLRPHILTKLRMRAAHQARAAVIAGHANSRFFRPEPYGGEADWIVAAVALTEACIVITVERKKAFFQNICGCTVRTLNEL
jgi:rRNA-processing protein FCF1